MNAVGLFAGKPGIGEILIVVLILVVFFGAKRLPELARSLGRSINEFKKGKSESLEEEKSPVEPEEQAKD